jgi:hypothetical protein
MSCTGGLLLLDKKISDFIPFLAFFPWRGCSILLISLLYDCCESGCFHGGISAELKVLGKFVKLQHFYCGSFSNLCFCSPATASSVSKTSAVVSERIPKKRATTQSLGSPRRTLLRRGRELEVILKLRSDYRRNERRSPLITTP